MRKHAKEKQLPGHKGRKYWKHLTCWVWELEGSLTLSRVTAEVRKSDTKPKRDLTQRERHAVETRCCFSPKKLEKILKGANSQLWRGCGRKGIYTGLERIYIFLQNIHFSTSHWAVLILMHTAWTSNFTCKNISQKWNVSMHAWRFPTL